MSGFIEKVTESVRKQDYFGQRVSLTFRGESKYKSVCGGLVTILVFAALSVQALFAFLKLQSDPLYKNFPITYDYNSIETF